MSSDKHDSMGRIVMEHSSNSYVIIFVQYDHRSPNLLQCYTKSATSVT